MSAGSNPKKKRPSGKLTALLLVILLIGVGVQLYNIYSQLQSAQAEQSYYAQLRDQLQLENDRLAEDIANSGDPTLIEDIARERIIEVEEQP